MKLSSGNEAHHAILSASRLLRRVRLIFDYWWVDGLAYIRHCVGWERAVACVPHIPDTVEVITVDFSYGAGPAGTNSALLFTDGLPRVEDWRQAFEDAVLRRESRIPVRLIAGGQPSFSLREQAELMALFPRLSQSGLLNF